MLEKNPTRIPHQTEILQQQRETQQAEVVGSIINQNNPYSLASLNQVQKKQVLNRIIDLYIAGVPTSEISEIILIEYKSLITDIAYWTTTVEQLLREASALMIESHNNQFEMIAVNHVFIYEKLFKFFRENNLIGGQMIALRQKEKLLGLHSDDSLINIDIETEVNDSSADTGYDLNRLTQEEAVRFQDYLKRIT